MKFQNLAHWGWQNSGRNSMKLWIPSQGLFLVVAMVFFLCNHRPTYFELFTCVKCEHTIISQSEDSSSRIFWSCTLAWLILDLSWQPVLGANYCWSSGVGSKIMYILLFLNSHFPLSWSDSTIMTSWELCSQSINRHANWSFSASD